MGCGTGHCRSRGSSSGRSLIKLTLLLDTCAFNWLLDGRTHLDGLPLDDDLVATHVQFDELNRTKCQARRNLLREHFREIVEREVPTASAVVGVSRLGRCRVSDGQLYRSLLGMLNQWAPGKPSNVADSLIAETAIVNGWVLVTADRSLANVAREHGCVVHLLTG